MLPKLRSKKLSKDTFCNTFWTGKFVLSVAVLKFLRFKIQPKKKYSCFRKYGWQKIFSPGRPQIYFFTRFSGYILFFSLVSFAFFNSYFFACLFVCLFVRCFLRLKMYIPIHIRLYADGWVIKKISPGRFSETRQLFVLAWTIRFSFAG